MNEVTLHRGRFPHLTSLGCFVDGEYLTECVVSDSKALKVDKKAYLDLLLG